MVPWEMHKNMKEHQQHLDKSKEPPSIFIDTRTVLDAEQSKIWGLHRAQFMTYSETECPWFRTVWPLVSKLKTKTELPVMN